MKAQKEETQKHPKIDNKDLEIVISALKEIQSKMFNVPNWFTNIGMASLAFYVGLIIQMRSEGYTVSTFLSAIIGGFLVLTIGIGLYIKFRYGLLDWGNRVSQLFNMIERIEEPEKEENDSNYNKILDIKKMLTLNGKKKIFPVALSIVQSNCYAAALTLLIGIIIEYIYFGN